MVLLTDDARCIILCMVHYCTLHHCWLFPIVGSQARMSTGVSSAIHCHAIAPTHSRFFSSYAELAAIETAGNDLARSFARKEVVKRDTR
jgi:hypothetical protein